MNKSEIINHLVRVNNISRKDAKKVVDSIFSTRNLEGIIVRSLIRNQRVSISGFGTFCIRRLGCRSIKVPTRNDEIINVPESWYVNFKPSKVLRNMIKIKGS